MYGQTGSGKTFTMRGMQKHLARDVFATDELSLVLLSSFELEGRECRDLLEPSDVPLQLLEDGNGNLIVQGLGEIVVEGENDLIQLLDDMAERRKTHATFANAESSRTHSFTKLRIRTSCGEGEISLVDLAGSERNKDSAHHDVSRQKESALINSSLMALKECVRKKQEKAGYIPFRSSELTRLLKPVFTSDNSKCAVIATVSPGATDCEHSLNTLQHALLMSGRNSESVCTIFEMGRKFELPEEKKEKERVRQSSLAPVKWSKEDVASWLKGIDPLCKVPFGTDGKQLIRFSCSRFVQACQGDAERGGRIFENLRKTIANVKAKGEANRNHARLANRASQLSSVKSISAKERREAMGQ
uniref:Kinesin-like protein n=2 Tax=Palpitomonas bilix TaxID=652834 RepID=A0A7S3GI95_9EUKA|mmetsp:Transcript_50382/g.129791  ORF Transcript_50382/g.129791 Transcript_50382/m.129791 type:complete len:359 (+) Transcript_50382:427-1503(+)